MDRCLFLLFLTDPLHQSCCLSSALSLDNCVILSRVKSATVVYNVRVCVCCTTQAVERARSGVGVGEVGGLRGGGQHEAIPIAPVTVEPLSTTEPV